MTGPLSRLLMSDWIGASATALSRTAASSEPPDPPVPMGPSGAIVPPFPEMTGASLLPPLLSLLQAIQPDSAIARAIVEILKSFMLYFLR